MKQFIKNNWMVAVWIGVILAIPVYFVSSFLITKYQPKDTTNQIADLNITADEIVEEKLPTIKSSELPGEDEDFDINKYEFLHGGYGGENGQYAKVVVDGDPIETDISISYSNEIRPLKLFTDKDIEKRLADAFEPERLKSEIDDELLEFGDTARYYLPYNRINLYYELDVDKDGIKEKLVTICGIESNHCSDYAEIIKGNNVIFSTEFYTNSIGIRPDKNGFYVSWTDESSFIDEDGVEHGACCEASHNKTLFSFIDGKFTPTKQWKVPHILKEVVDN